MWIGNIEGVFAGPGLWCVYRGHSGVLKADAAI